MRRSGGRTIYGFEAQPIPPSSGRGRGAVNECLLPAGDES